MGRKFSLIVLALLFVLGAAVTGANAAAVITNGSGVYLGVNDEGHLNYSDGVTRAENAGDGQAVGVAYRFPSGALLDATSPGCLCEGWGVAATSGATTYSGSADVSVGGVQNIVVDSFTSNASSATSVTHLGSLPGLTVSQAYAPSASTALFENRVTITNTTDGTLTNVRYTRAMDWDIPPEEFSEYVTIAGLPAANVLFTSNNGFATPNPTSTGDRIDIGVGCGINSNFTDCGISDHGAVFDFGFGDLAAGESREFSIFYGAAANEAAALAALGVVDAEVYSLGQTFIPGSRLPANDSVTYIFAFKGVGGTPIDDTNPIPEPGTMLLLGSGLVGLMRIRRSKV